MRAIYLGRLGRAAGLEAVLHAMVLLRSEYPELELVVAGRAGSDDASMRYRWCMEALADDLGLTHRVTFLDRDPRRGEHGPLLRAADVVISQVGDHRLWVGRTGGDDLPTGAVVDASQDEVVADAIHVTLDPRAGRVLS